MFEWDKWREIFQTLVRNKLRTLLTATGVIWAVFMIILMLSGASGLENGIMKNMDGLVTNSYFVWGWRTSRPYKGLKAGRRIKMTNPDVDAVRQNVEEVELCLPRLSLGGYRETNNIRRGSLTGSFSVMGDTPEFTRIQPSRIIAGRWLNPLDMEEKRKVAVIGTRVRDILFPEKGEVIGQSIDIQGVYFTVVGVFESVKADESRAQSELETIHCPITTLQYSLTKNPERITWMALLAKEGVNAADAEEATRNFLRERYKIAPDDPMGVGGWNVQEEFDKFRYLFIGIRALVWLVGIGMLAAGVIGVMNIMLIAIKERTKEIGIRKAIGATPWRVIGMILHESVVITALAGLFGMLLGLGGNLLFVRLAEQLENAPSSQGGMDFVMFSSPDVSSGIYLSIFVILFLAGLMAGVLPAIRATQVNPIKALRSE